jgi:hypothetical protein
MKKIIFFVIGALMGTVSLQAQSATAVHTAAKVANKMKDSLNLSTDQRSLIYEINLRIAEERETSGNSYPSGDSTINGLRGLAPWRDTMYKRVLSPEQFQRYIRRKTAFQ